MSEHEIKVHHQPSEGFDHSEPKTGAIWMFVIFSAISLVIVIWALQQYFEKIWNDAVYERVLAPPSEQLKAVRERDDWDLTHPMYLNKQTGQVRIPLARAQELFMQEVAAGKPFYPGKPTAPKKDDADGWQPTSSPAGGAAPGTAAAPATAPAAPNTEPNK